MYRIRIFFRIAATRGTIVTGIKVALIVGCILNLINQGELFIHAAWGEIQWPKVLLTFCVPFCVSVYSATVARLRFDPGTRAFMEAQLACVRCGKKRLQVSENEIVPECSGCGKRTAWRLSE
jgi:hypothetical protein